MIKKKMIVLAIIGSIVTASYAYAANLPIHPTTIPSAGTPNKVPMGGDCYGETQHPHFSSHVPGTINTTSITSCSGHQVSVKTTVFIGGNEKTWKVAANQFTSKRSIAKLESSWVCQLGHTYKVTAISIHADDTDRTALTRNGQTVFCGMANPVPKVPAKNK
jgi:hypothetical protein